MHLWVVNVDEVAAIELKVLTGYKTASETGTGDVLLRGGLKCSTITAPVENPQSTPSVSG